MRNINLTLILLFAFTYVQAAHIIGGDLSYACLGTGEYGVTMKIYRDCQGQGAAFDSAPGAFTQASVTIFMGNNTTPIDVIYLDAPVIEDVDPSGDNPCVVVPPNVCIQEGVYYFELDLPVSTESYWVIYQRCCRNNSITNIFNPEAAGSTYGVEIVPEAQNVCNNSPVFNSFPPPVICVNETLNYDHGATDADGDQLVYSFCSPLNGGTQMAPAPDPDSAPPYSEVNFILPNYTALAPIGGDPVVTIDPITGVISGTPTEIGQFVVGICVQEFRNGVLMSTSQRDFQFNVSFCEPVIDAGLQGNVEVQEYTIINSCVETEIDFINESTDQQFINAYLWAFDIDGSGVNPLTSNQRNITVDFPGPGVYTGVMVVNPGEVCTDTANFIVTITPPIEPDFFADYDTCIAGPVAFTEIGSESDLITDWNWEFGDGFSSTEEAPIHEYLTPGLKEVHLVLTDTIGCVDSITKSFNWFPVPPLIIIEPSEALGCPPLEVTFNNLSTPVDTSYSIIWDFGDGTILEGISPTHIYESPDIYDINVEITSPIGCFTSDEFIKLIEVDSLPVANFNFDPPNPSNFDNVVGFEDASLRAAWWEWTFDRFGTSLGATTAFAFPDTGKMDVTLMITHPYGCLDSITKVIDVEPKVTFYLPNAFTPNGDGKNEDFGPVGVFRGITNYEMKIVSRWGESIFESNDPNALWNGRKGNTGDIVPNGVYVVLIKYTEPRGTEQMEQAFITVIR